MASGGTTQGQENVVCNLCQDPVSFFCRRCGLNLCDQCALLHLRVKTKFGHDVVDFASKDDDDSCLCDSHPQHECSAYCKTCDLPICILCVSIKHKSHEIFELHDKIEELLKDITRENNRLQLSCRELKNLLNHTTKQLASLSSFYQKRKDEVTDRGKEWHKLIDNHVKKLHQELDDLKKEHEARLQKQKQEFEEMIENMDEMDWETIKFQKSKNVAEMQKFKPRIEEQKTMKEFTQYTFPAFHDCKIDENHLKTYFGFIEKIQENKISLTEKRFVPDTVSSWEVLQVPSVSSVIDTGFPANERNGNRLYCMALSDDKNVWMGGYGKELKLFDLQGELLRTVTITLSGMYICMYNKHVVFHNQQNKTLKISDDNTVVTMFTTGDWKPYGITESASGDLLVCLLSEDESQSKVVRYSSTGTVLQEIQYDSQCQPLYQTAWHIAENVNQDIIVTDCKKDVVVVVDRLGILRYTYSGDDNDLLVDVYSLATDSVGHIFITGYKGGRIHMLDIDGIFLRYIIPDGGIKFPRAICVIGDGEIIVGECKTGLAKRIRYLEGQT